MNVRDPVARSHTSYPPLPPATKCRPPGPNDTAGAWRAYVARRIRTAAPRLCEPARCQEALKVVARFPCGTAGSGTKRSRTAAFRKDLKVLISRWKAVVVRRHAREDAAAAVT